MDVLREQLVYKNVPVHICMKSLKPVEHYEVIRLILATRTENVFVCTHESTNSYIDGILKTLPIQFYQCFVPECLNQGGSLLPPFFSSVSASSGTD